MTVYKPLVFQWGAYLNLPDGDTIKNPENASFTYTAGKLTTINYDNGYVTLTYNGTTGKLQTVYNSYSGKTSTFTYNSEGLASISITP